MFYCYFFEVSFTEVKVNGQIVHLKQTRISPGVSEGTHTHTAAYQLVVCVFLFEYALVGISSQLNASREN